MKILLLLIALNTSATLFAEQVQKVTKKDLIGMWIVGIAQFNSIKFNQDGTYVAHIGWASDNKALPGSYSIEGKEIILNPAKNSEDSSYYGKFVNKSKWALYNTAIDKKTVNSYYMSIYYTIELRSGTEHFYHYDSEIKPGATLILDSKKVEYQDSRPICIAERTIVIPYDGIIEPGRIVEAAFKTLEGRPWYVANVAEELPGIKELPDINAWLRWIPESATGLAVVTENRVNYRTGPSLEENQIGQLNKGDKIKLIKFRNEEEIGDLGYHHWYQFTKDSGETGWVFGAFVECPKK